MGLQLATYRMGPQVKYRIELQVREPPDRTTLNPVENERRV